MNFLGWSGAFAILAIIIAVLGGAYFAQRFFKLKVPFVNKLASKQVMGIAGILLLVMVGFYYLGGNGQALSIGGMTTGGSGQSSSSGLCVSNPNAPTNNYLVAIQNKDNPTLTYLADNVYLVGPDGKTIYTSGATTAGTTLTYLTLQPASCAAGRLISTTNATFAVDFAADQPQKQAVIHASLGSALGVKALNYNTGADATANSTGLGIGVVGSQSAGGSLIAVANATMGSGSSDQFKLQYTVNTSNAQYGAYNSNAGVIFSAYISNLAKFSQTAGIVLSGIDNGATLTQTACPSDIVQQRRANICWVAPTLKAGRTYTVTGQITSDLGDPVPGDYIALYTNDVQYAQDADGSFKMMSYTAAGTNVGDGTDTTVTFLFN